MQSERGHSRGQLNKRQFNKRLLWAAGGLGLAVVLAAAWWLGFLTPEPDEVSLAETVAAVEAAAEEPGADEPAADEPGAEEPVTDEPAEQAPAEDDAQPAADPSPVPSATAVEVPTGSTLLAGAWRIEAGDTTFVGYRADSPTGEAVGRTRGVNGELIASDTTILAVDISADMSTLASDSRFRDEHLGTEGLETQRYKTSRFVLTMPIDVGVVATDGAAATFDAVGELTVKQATVPVTVTLEGTIVGDKLVVVGSTPLDLNDFDATISGIETATMEFSLVFVSQT